MSNSKISALTSATTPLAGTEVLPVVQSSATTKVTVANLTAGRAVSATQYTSTIAVGTAPLVVTSTTNVANLNASSLNGATFASPGAIGSTAASTGAFTTLSATGAISANNTATGAGVVGAITSSLTYTNAGVVAARGIIVNNPVASGSGAATYVNSVYIDNASGGTTSSASLAIGTVPPSGTYSIYTSGACYSGGLLTIANNIVQGTAAKGFDFSANTPLAGKTSTILNWYEEGTWTPNQGAGLTLVGAFSSTGKYTRIGRNVTVSGTVTGATSVAVTAAGVITSNLPFTAGTAGHGNATNAAVTASAAVICTSTSVTSAAAIAATGTITFSATYFV
jgi:hypothetical protein